MTASQIQTSALIAPVADYEPPLIGEPAALCPTPSPAALHRSTRPPLRSVDRMRAETPPRAACVFAEATLRSVLEVIDRRRPLTQLRHALTPPLLDMVLALSRTAGPGKAAVLRRVRLRVAGADAGQPVAAEVFATYTRGRRVRAIAGRIEVTEGRWRLVALHIG